VSVNTRGTPLIDTSTSGITPDWSQRPAQPVPFGPMSDVSKKPAELSQPSAAPVAVCVTMNCWPGCSTVPCGHMSKAHVLSLTITESSVTASGVLFTIRAAPASKVQLV